MQDGTYLVTAADDETATLRDVHDAQVLAVAANPGVETGEVLDATVEAEPPLEVAYRFVEIERQRTIPVERIDESPTTLARDLAAGQDEGAVTRRDRAGQGEVHVLTVPADRVEQAAEDVAADEETIARAARLDVTRVEIRTGDGVVSVRYLPD